MKTQRRTLLAAGGLMLLMRPAWATPESLRKAIDTFAGGKEVRNGRVTLAIDPLVEKKIKIKKKE